jgi:hypothetical protein
MPAAFCLATVILKVQVTLGLFRYGIDAAGVERMAAA